MVNNEIGQRRLINQRISTSDFAAPEDVVGWLGAVQAQDYFGAKWALGLRMKSAVDNDIERAFTDGRILRTHLLRPTWHFVTPVDIRWMLALTAPRVRAACDYMFRKHGLDRDLFNRSNRVLEKVLQKEKEQTRDELGAALGEAGIETSDGNRLSYLMMSAELDGLICSGPRRGKQFTYSLLAERAPHAVILKSEEALAELTRRFFISRGPATAQDYAKWSGLTLSDARLGIESVKSSLQSEVIDGQSYWSSNESVQYKTVQTAHLLSVFDEYISGYKDHTIVCEDETGAKLSAMGNGLTNVIVIDGQIIGSCRRTFKKHSMVIELNPIVRLTEDEIQAIIQAAQKCSNFFQLPADIIQSSL